MLRLKGCNMQHAMDMKQSRPKNVTNLHNMDTHFFGGIYIYTCIHTVVLAVLHASFAEALTDTV